MRDWLARTFPTLARLERVEWLMLGLTVMIGWSCLLGIALSFMPVPMCPPNPLCI